MTHADDDTLILEGILTTLREDGSVNVAPMGPRVDRACSQLVLRPFRTSTTYQNLKRHGEGVFHVTDDVLLLAQGAIGQLHEMPPMFPATAVRGMILADACRWLAFRVTELDDTQERTTIRCEVVDRGRLRDFFGFNRAKHAALEAAILATRVEILPAAAIREQLAALVPLVDKTAGQQERQAFQILKDYIDQQLK
ncbi:MAG: DUF447 family protein [Pirellulaceae bacterium]|nr:DUF447 family protein [Pirellulaceae bacterium]